VDFLFFGSAKKKPKDGKIAPIEGNILPFFWADVE
jgi:hypothetical protein